jgi:hypothetical protein
MYPSYIIAFFGCYYTLILLLLLVLIERFAISENASNNSDENVCNDKDKRLSSVAGYFIGIFFDTSNSEWINYYCFGVTGEPSGLATKLIQVVWQSMLQWMEYFEYDSHIAAIMDNP